MSEAVVLDTSKLKLLKLGNSLILETPNGDALVERDSIHAALSALKPARVTKPGMGRDKGNSFELDVAQKMSAWWFLNPLGRVIKRCPLSGGWSKTLAGSDLISEIEPFPWAVECKHNKDWTLNDLLNPTMGLIGDFWRQCVGEVVPGSNKIPLLVFRGNFGKTHILYKRSDLSFHLHSSNRYLSFVDHNEDDCVITHFNSLLEFNVERLIMGKMIPCFTDINLYRQQLEEAKTKFPPKVKAPAPA